MTALHNIHTWQLIKESFFFSHLNRRKLLVSSVFVIPYFLLHATADYVPTKLTPLFGFLSSLAFLSSLFANIVIVKLINNPKATISKKNFLNVSKFFPTFLFAFIFYQIKVFFIFVFSLILLAISYGLLATLTHSSPITLIVLTPISILLIWNLLRTFTQYNFFYFEIVLNRVGIKESFILSRELTRNRLNRVTYLLWPFFLFCLLSILPPFLSVSVKTATHQPIFGSLITLAFLPIVILFLIFSTIYEYKLYQKLTDWPVYQSALEKKKTVSFPQKWMTVTLFILLCLQLLAVIFQSFTIDEYLAKNETSSSFDNIFSRFNIIPNNSNIISVPANDTRMSEAISKAQNS